MYSARRQAEKKIKEIRHNLANGQSFNPYEDLLVHRSLLKRERGNPPLVELNPSKLSQSEYKNLLDQAMYEEALMDLINRQEWEGNGGDPKSFDISDPDFRTQVQLREYIGYLKKNKPKATRTRERSKSTSRSRHTATRSRSRSRRGRSSSRSRSRGRAKAPTKNTSRKFRPTSRRGRR